MTAEIRFDYMTDRALLDDQSTAALFVLSARWAAHRMGRLRAKLHSRAEWPPTEQVPPSVRRARAATAGKPVARIDELDHAPFPLVRPPVHLPFPLVQPPARMLKMTPADWADAAFMIAQADRRRVLRGRCARTGMDLS